MQNELNLMRKESIYTFFEFFDFEEPPLDKVRALRRLLHILRSFSKKFLSKRMLCLS